MIALVSLVILYTTSAGSRLNVSGTMSANTGFAPSRHTALAVAKNVKLGTITSSPGPTPSASSDQQQSHRCPTRSQSRAPCRNTRPWPLRTSHTPVHARTRPTRETSAIAASNSASSRLFSRVTSSIGTEVMGALAAGVLAVCIDKILGRESEEARKLDRSAPPVNLKKRQCLQPNLPRQNNNLPHAEIRTVFAN